MKSKIFMLSILCLLLFCVLELQAQQAYIFKETNNLYGLKDSKGKIILEPKYDDIGKFEHGLARVRLGKIEDVDNWKYGFIDVYGKELVKPKYKRAGGFDEGLAPVLLDKKWGFINYIGVVMIPFMYSNVSHFKEGLVAVTTSEYPNEKWGFIDKTGKIVLSFIYDEAKWFEDGIALVKVKGKYGYINKAGKPIIPIEYDGAYEFSEGLAAVNKGGSLDKYGLSVQGGKWGFIDKTGKLVIPYQYDRIEPFSEGLACVMQNKKAGYIDRTGKIIIPLQFETLSSFQYGKAPVTLNGRGYHIDKNGKEASPSKLVNFSNAEYIGEVGNDGTTPNGYGKIIWKNGNVYEGQVQNGKRQGTGKLVWANGDVYEGQFQNDKMHGKGKLTLKDGKVYEGDFENGKFVKPSANKNVSTTDNNNNVQPTITRKNKYATLPAPEPAATNFYNALKEAKDSKTRGATVNVYENSVMGMNYSEADKVRLIADAYAAVMEIDFHGVWQALMKTKDLTFTNNKVIKLLPQDQQEGIKTWAKYISGSAAAKNYGKPLPPRPANIPEPGIGWGRSVNNNVPTKNQ